jgi:alpha-tubulin suppressor-like RCC1 family protein
MAWGENGSGQLGNGTTTKSDLPVAVSGLSGVSAIAAGGAHSLAVLSNGTVMAWGSGGSGQLGDGEKGQSDVPVPVCAPLTEGPCPAGPYLEGVTAVSGSSNNSLARLSNGTVMAWGDNNQGQLGNGTETASDVPVAVSGLSGVSAIAAGGDLVNGGQPFSLALLNNGTVMAWGQNEYGQLGDGTSTGPEQCGILSGPCSKTPVKVSGLNGVAAIAARGTHSLALLSDTTVKAWGRNNFGQLGDGTSTGPEPCSEGACSTTPVEVSKLGNVMGIGAGPNFSLAFGPPPPPAGLPEAGRCVKVAPGTGKYSSGSCLTPAKRESAKKYEWMPASVTEQLGFSGSGVETTLTTAGHSTIKCIGAALSGEWTGPRTASVTAEFHGCTNASGAQCQTVPNPTKTKSLMTFFGVLGELGYIKYEEVEGKLRIAVGLDLKPYPPGNPSLASYECTGSSEVGHIEGSVIGKLTPINTMTTTSNLLYFARKSGEQIPEYFQGAPKDTLMTSFTSGLPAEESLGSGASSLNIKEYKGSNAAPLEIKAK